jgi:hypothetical protein
MISTDKIENEHMYLWKELRKNCYKLQRNAVARINKRDNISLQTCTFLQTKTI